MTQEKLDNANELFCKIQDLENCISHIESESKVRDNYVLNWYFDYEDDKEQFKKSCLKFLKQRLSNYKRQFNKI